MGFTDEILAHWDLTYSATALACSGAEEIAAGLLGRSLMTAEVAGDHFYLFTPQRLNTIGREIILQGESLWRYEAGALVWEQSVATGQERNVLRFAVNVNWQTGRGMSALQCAPHLKKMLRQIEIGIERESRVTPYYVAPVPLEQSAAQALWRSFKKLLMRRPDDHVPENDPTIEGAPQMLVEGEQAGTISGYQATGNYVQKRLGIDTPQNVTNLMIEVQKTALFAMGIPAPVVYPADANSMREAWRIYLATVVESITRVIMSEAKRNDLDLKLTFPELKSSDVAARARSFRELVMAGMSVEQAANISGVLMEMQDAGSAGSGA